MPNVELSSESLRASVLQALLSRGDRSVGRLLSELAEGVSLKAACRNAGLELEHYVTRERGEDESFPWEVLDSGVARDYLWQEYRKAQSGVTTPRCSPGCQRCGVCG